MSWYNHNFLSYAKHEKLSEKEFLKYIFDITTNENKKESFKDRNTIVTCEISNRICKLGSLEYQQIESK